MKIFCWKLAYFEGTKDIKKKRSVYSVIRWQSGHIWLGLGCGFSEFQESVNEKAKKHVPECFPHLVL